ncbi:MAG: type II toxin-antitoxin system RelE/ParE family toxin [Candidatus Kapaibacteriales bacterium]
MYEIYFTKRAAKEYKALDATITNRVDVALSNLSINPRREGSIKLKNRFGYRIRVGKYRVIYDILDDVLVIEVIKIAHRKDVYTEKK